LEYADIIDKQITITYYPNQKHRFSANFERGEVKQGSMLKGEFGNGLSANEAINNYVDLIRNKKLVFNAMLDSRQEFACPDSITGIN
jgi:hypothetical protein